MKTFLLLLLACVTTTGFSQKKEMQFIALSQLIDEGNSIEFIRVFNKTKFDPNYRFKSTTETDKIAYVVDQPLIFIAASKLENGDTSIYDFLIQNGADVNLIVETERGKRPTLLHVLLETTTDFKRAISLVKEYGFDPTIESKVLKLKWPLSYYLPNLNKTDKGKKLAQLLLAKGLSLNLMGKYGAAAIHMAVDKGDIAAIQRLKKNGADLNLATGFGWRSKKMTSEEIKKAKIGYTPLMIAVRKGHIEAVKQLLKYKQIDTTLKNKSGQTALDIALDRDRKEIIKLLKN